MLFFYDSSGTRLHFTFLLNKTLTLGDNPCLHINLLFLYVFVQTYEDIIYDWHFFGGASLAACII